MNLTRPLNAKEKKFMSDHPNRLYSSEETGIVCLWCKTDDDIKPESVFGKQMCHRCERFDVVEVE